MPEIGSSGLMSGDGKRGVGRGIPSTTLTRWLENISASSSPATFQALAFEDYTAVLVLQATAANRTREVFGFRGV
jgi:hypothetical protein